MEVILLQKVANLGNVGDRVKVKSGFGRNYLLPQGKATVATPDNVARFEARRHSLDLTGRFVGLNSLRLAGSASAGWGGSHGS